MVPQKPGIAFVDYETEAQVCAAAEPSARLAAERLSGRILSRGWLIKPTCSTPQATMALMGLNGFKITSTHSLGLSYAK